MNHTDNYKLECKHCSCYLGNLHINTHTETKRQNVVIVPFKKNNATITKTTNYVKTEVLRRETSRKSIFRRKNRMVRTVSVSEVQMRCNRCSKHTTFYSEKEI